ncbi:hypothetical protein AGMMS49975_29580 [Clostridia bacterium]|nr:hypothetical protein AGMMS49975_29580 [Clostridia bacterium]
MDLHERIRYLRKEILGISSQELFGEQLGVNRDIVKNIELGNLKKPEQKEPLLRLICATFGVRYEWLKNGIGEPLEVNNESIFSELKSKYNLSSFDEKVVRAFTELSQEKRNIIQDFLSDLLTGKSTETEVDNDTEIYDQSFDAINRKIAKNANDAHLAIETEKLDSQRLNAINTINTHFDLETENLKNPQSGELTRLII